MKLVISKDNRVVSIHGADGKEHTINLSNKQFDILYFLARHKNVVCSREDIKSAVWGEVIVGDRNVDVHVTNINNATRLVDKDLRVVDSVIGHGYRVGDGFEITIINDSDQRMGTSGCLAPVYKDGDNTVHNVVNVADSEFGRLVVYFKGNECLAVKEKKFMDKIKKGDLVPA